jgi:hypothetical protein
MGPKKEIQANQDLYTGTMYSIFSFYKFDTFVSQFFKQKKELVLQQEQKCGVKAPNRITRKRFGT